MKRYETTQFLVNKADVVIQRAGMLTFFYKIIKPIISKKYENVHLAAYTCNEMRVVVHSDNFNSSDFNSLPKYKSIFQALPEAYVITFGD